MPLVEPGSQGTKVEPTGSALVGHDVPVGRALRQLRLLTMIVPAAFIALIEVSVHLIVGDRVPRATAVIVVLAIVATGSALFAWLIFHILKRIQNRLVQRNRQIAAVHNAGLSLASEMTLEPLLRKFVDLAREITNAKYGALGIVRPDGALEHFITSGLSAADRARIGVPPTGRGLLGVMIKSGTSLRLKDLTQDPRSVGFPPDHPPMHMLLGVPVVYKEHIVGHLYLTEKQGADEFSMEDEEMVRLFAAQAAISIETARLLERSQDLAILEERDRIGMDLHDGAIQVLYGVGLNLEDCASLVATEPDAVASRLDRAINDLGQVIKDIRSYIFHLRPAAYGAGTLSDALLDLAQEVRVNSLMDVEIDVQSADASQLPHDLAEHLFHVAQEALANVAKHSRATRAWVRLRTDGNTLTLNVRDNGRGFDTSSSNGVGHRGLGNIADRTRAIGGDLQLTSAPGEGTAVCVHVRHVTELSDD
jgi:signal transduction histidine kinase